MANRIRRLDIENPSNSLWQRFLAPLVDADRVLLILLGFFLAFGLIIIYDATAILSQDLYGFAYRFLLLQLVWILAGFIGFYFFLTVDLNTLKKLATPLFGISTFILLILAIVGLLPCNVNFIFAPCINGANRWFYLNPPPLPNIPLLGVLGFQPSEFAKLTTVVFISAMLSKFSKKNEDKSTEFFAVLLFALLIFVLVVLQPNLSTASLLFLISMSILFASNSTLKPLLYLVPAGLVSAISLILLSPYRRQRLLTFLSQDTATAELTTDYHINQILIALGSGGLTGVGFGKSRQKFQYLPEVFADSIFAIIGEELGFLGTALLVVLFGFLLYKGYTIAKNSESYFGRLLATGVTTWIALQFFVNVGSMTKLIPLTGIPLPLISYGGSSLVFMLSGLGILANVSRTSTNKRR